MTNLCAVYCSRDYSSVQEFLKHIKVSDISLAIFLQNSNKNPVRKQKEEKLSSQIPY